MPAAQLDLIIEQGSTWIEAFDLTQQVVTDGVPQVNADGDPVLEIMPLTGHTARMQARSTVVSDTQLVTLTTENGGIVIDGAAGRITLTMSAAATALLSWSAAGQYVGSTGMYQLELITPGGVVSRLLAGKITLDPEIVR